MSAERVLEVHGAVRWLQCSKPCCPDVWKAPSDLQLTEDATHRVAGVMPTCPKCKAVARPNVQMFGGDSAPPARFTEEERLEMKNYKNGITLDKI